MRVRVAIFSTHPIQYQAPWYRALAARPDLEITVYFGCLPDAETQGTGFGQAFEWDVPLLDGYRWAVLANWRRRPGIARFTENVARGLTGLLGRMKPDVVVTTGWQQAMLLQAAWSARRLAIPCVVRGESSGLQPRKQGVRLVHSRLLGLYDAFLAIGKSNKAFYRGYGVPAERLFNCPYFIDNDYFLSKAGQLRSERARLREAWRIPAGSACFLFAGKLVRKKRVMDFLQAVDRAFRESPGVYGLVAGSGEQMEEARNFASSRRLSVTFAGFLNQSEIASAYVAADCLVLPSDYGETWGLVVNEAMACGLPAVVSDQVGCGPDLVSKGETGEIFPMGDVGKLAKTMAALARDPEKMRLMGEAANRRIMAEYSVERAVEGTLEAIDWVLDRAGRSRD